MSDFKTRSEMDTASEFIAYLELLRSGAIVGTDGGAIGVDGINRALERLAENSNTLLQAVQGAKATFLTGGGTVSFTGTALAWSADFTLRFPGELGAVASNVISSGGSPLVLANGNIVYVILDRVTDGAAVTFAVAASMAAFLSTITGSAARLDYLPIAHVDTGTGILSLFNGQRLLSGSTYTLSLGVDSQYGQQTELTLVHDNEIENLNMRLVGGGDISWDAATAALTFSQDLTVVFPLNNAGGTNILDAGSYSVGGVSTDGALYMTLSRKPGGAVNRTGSTFNAFTGSVPTGDNTFILAVHNATDGRVYLADGTALSDGETVKLGGVRLGVQFFIQEAGNSGQVLDLQSFVGGAFYRVASGELMVYRNGVKAKASKAYWEGAYPTGSLNVGAGGIVASDDYIEEDNNGAPSPNQGYRIIWIRDTDTPSGTETSTSVYRAASANDPPTTWPATDDSIEAFIGTQAQTPTILVPNGIYGFEAVWTHDNNTLRTLGGTLAYNGAQYKSSGATPMDLSLDGTTTPTDVFPAETLSADSWAYIYMGPGASLGAAPVLRISTTPPDDSGDGAGLHPSDGTFFFLTSVWLSTLSSFRSFVKTGSWVRFTQNSDQDLAGSFASAVAAGFVNVDISSNLPATTMAVRLWLLAQLDVGVGNGDLVGMSVRQSGTSWTGTPLRALKPANDDDVSFEFDTICPDGTFDIRLVNTEFASVNGVTLLGYAEGRLTSGDTMGA